MSLPIRARRTAAALAAMFLVASMGLAAWHRATVLHGVCAEHGEALHFAKVSGAVEHPVNSLTPADYVPIEGDEHCEIIAAQHNPVDGPSSPPSHHVALASHEADTIAIVPVAVADTLYRLAPKTSPPVG